MNLQTHKFIYLIILVTTLLGFTGCGRPPLDSKLQGDVIAGRRAWSQVVKLQTLKASALLSWKSTDGSQGKYKVRLFLEPPERLKIQWLTPWGSVAGQLIMEADQFWFSDARQRVTWCGRKTDLKNLFKLKENRNWESATQFFIYWPLLFSSPQEDDVTFAGQALINYFTTGEGRYLNKVINFKDGDEMHIRLDDLVALSDDSLFPRTLEALSHGGQISLSFKHYELQKELVPETFSYNLKNFSLRECSTR